MTLTDFACVVLMALAWSTAAYLAGRYASPRRHPHQTQGDLDMSQVTDAFAAYVAARDAQQAKAVSDAVAAEQANHQAEIDAAVAASEAADAAVIAAATPAA